jgi:plasmid stabilization system protein ParE
MDKACACPSSAIYDYIAKDSTVYARRMVDRLTLRFAQLVDFPMMGRQVTEYDSEYIREILEGHYRIIYRIKPAQIDVLAVIHSSQLLPKFI